ncbi:hypothetical protein BGM19_26820 [Streptomyces agglomeratus]|nr:hypothetical protein BGM19_26820 [Streptomyces agglomeratus]
MTSAHLVVHRPSISGGRRLTAHRHGRDETLGTAYSDHDLVVLLEAAGVDQPDTVMDDPHWVEWWPFASVGRAGLRR